METALRCPKCAVDMSPFAYEGVDLDLCPRCKGLWFDRGELAKTLGGTPPPLGGPASLSLDDGGGTPCPRCATPLGERRLAEDFGLIVDACPRCEGVFLDRGELERIRRLARKPRHITKEDQVAFGRAGLSGQQLDSLARARRSLALESEKRPTFREAEGNEWWWFFFLSLPLEEDTSVVTTSWATFALIAANLAIWAWQLNLGVDRSVALYGMVPTEVLHGQRLYTLLSSEFVHGGWPHLLGNMYFLFLFGDNVEERLGMVGFLLLYAAAGVGADALTLFESARLAVPHVGASGAIAGVMAAYVVLFPGARILTPVMRFWWRVWVAAIPAWVYIGGWLAINAVGAWSGGAGIAWWAHIGGFAVGFLAVGAWRALRGGDADRSAVVSGAR